MTKDAWNPNQYERFKNERRRPVADLLALIQRKSPPLVLDLGCGTGEWTRDLHRAIQAKKTIGIDSSAEMLKKAAALAGGGLSFEKADIQTYLFSEPCDVIFSNAALHWCSDQKSLLRKAHHSLTPGGEIAIQMPANQDYPSHTVGRKLAQESPFREALGESLPDEWSEKPEVYAEWLDEMGFSEQVVLWKVYGAHLESREEVIEWVKGSFLTFYERQLPPDLYQQFLTTYRERLFAVLPDRKPFFYPFKRVLFWGKK